MPEEGRNRVTQPQPRVAHPGRASARELNNATSELMDRLSLRLLRLRTIGGPEAELIAMECERALADIRAELEAMASGEKKKDL